MKKTTYIATIIILLTAPLAAAEKNDCSKINKFSKAFLSCKSNNIKNGITQKFSKTGNPLKGIMNYQKKAWSKD